jgi:hypothetical protein
LETDTGRLKMGNGANWNSIPYTLGAQIPVPSGGGYLFSPDGQTIVTASVPTPRRLNMVWRFPNSTLATGAYTESFHVWDAGIITSGPRLEMDLPSTTTPMVVDIQYNTGSGWASVYSGTYPTIPINTTVAFGLAPITQNMPGGCDMRAYIIQCPPGPGANPNPATIGATSTGSTGAGTSSNLLTVLPSTAGASATDQYLMAVSFQSNGSPAIVMTTPPGWTLLSSVTEPSNNTTLNLYSIIYGTGPVAPSLLTTRSGGAQATITSYWIGRIVGASTGLLVGSPVSTAGADNQTSMVTPSIATTAGACDIVLEFASLRYSNAGASSAPPSWTIGAGFAGGPPGLAMNADVVTTRNPNGSTNQEIWVGTASAVAAGGSISAATLTPTGCGGAAPTLQAAVISTVALIQRAPSTSGPSVMTVQQPISG